MARLRRLRKGEAWKRSFKCGEGWNPFIKGFLSQAQFIAREDGLSLRVRDIKHVHGHLQVHILGANERLWELMRYVEHVSGFICEPCGGPSQAVERGGQLTTRCLACLLRPDTPASWTEEPSIPIIGEQETARTSGRRGTTRRELATVGGAEEPDPVQRQGRTPETRPVVQL